LRRRSDKRHGGNTPLTPRTVLAGGFSALILVAALAAALSPSPGPASAACSDSPEEPQIIFAFDPPPAGFEVRGTAPFDVTVKWVPGATVLADSTAVIDWGDGSPPTLFHGTDCGDGIAIEWPPQSHAHTYKSAGSYTLTWTFTSAVINFGIPIAFVVAEPAQAATPTSTPTVPPTPAPTPIPPAAAPATVVPAPASAVATASQGVPATAVPSPTRELPDATPVSPTPTPTTASPVAGAPAVTPATTGSGPATPEADIPEALSAMPRLAEVATDPGTIATNVALAGVTLWVLFSSVLLNQVLQEHRSELDERTSRLTRPLRRFAGRATPAGAVPGVLGPILVLALTGIIYGLLDPGFGPNRSSAVLFLSVILGVGAVTYACSGIEALMTRRMFGVAAAVRPYPASLAIAAASVAFSRIIGLQPGVIYGFVASCATIGPGSIDERRQGRVTIYPVLTAIVLSVAAWFLIEPLRANDSIASSFLGQVGIAAGIIVFISGLEGVALNMIPLSVTDGGKLFRWRPPVWAAVALFASFLFWHVVINRNRQFFDALRQAESLAMLTLFLLYTSLSVGLWAYFRWRPHRLDIAPQRD